MNWRPDITREAGALPERILTVLRRDIETGGLASGVRLPPQRELAFALGVSLGVVTKAYAEAERRGLVSGEVGRGTYVRGDTPPDGAFTLTSTTDGLADMARNYPPVAPAKQRMAAALTALSRRDLAALCDYGAPAGVEAHRRSAAAWIQATTGHAADWRRLVVTIGAQQAISAALKISLGPGEALMCEAATFHGVRLAASQSHLRVQALAMDHEGVLPEALDRLAALGARVAYLMPTLQNPTGRTMSLARRKAIVEVARARDLTIIEDEVYSGYAGDELGQAPPALAALAPERVIHISGTSKLLTPGVRTGFLAAPDDRVFNAAVQAVRAEVYAVPAFGPALFHAWVESGEALAIARENRAEARQRLALAIKHLGQWLEPPASSQSLHVWAPLGEAAAERAAARALRAGIEVTPPSAVMLDAGLISGFRLCLGQVPADELERHLAVIGSILSGAEGAERQRVV